MIRKLNLESKPRHVFDAPLRQRSTSARCSSSSASIEARRFGDAAEPPLQPAAGVVAGRRRGVPMAFSARTPADGQPTRENSPVMAKMRRPR